jgi:hypothetical protein
MQDITTQLDLVIILCLSYLGITILIRIQQGTSFQGIPLGKNSQSSK